MSDYWLQARKMAWAEALALLGLQTREQVMLRVVAAAALIAALWLLGLENASTDELIIRALITLFILVALPVVFAWKLFVSVPPTLHAQQVEKCRATEAAMKSISNEIANTLIVSASVETLESSSASDELEWHLMLENSGSRPIQFGQVTILASLDDAQPAETIGRGGILRANQSSTYKIPFKQKYEKREGTLMLAIELEYGVVDRPPSRKVSQTLKIPFKPRGAITFSDCHTVSFTDRQSEP